MKASKGSTSSRVSDCGPPNKAEQLAMAQDRGPADENVLENLAQYADRQADIGEWHYGYVTAQRLRLLAQMLEKQQEIGQEERQRLHRTIADLAQQVDEAAQDGQNIELVFRFELDGPGTVQIGGLHLMVSLLADIGRKDGATG
jgi:hypothetical protein